MSAYVSVDWHRVLTSCSALMYNHRSERNRVDVVDLDPYGTAAPFVDGAVQCVNDGGGYSNPNPASVCPKTHLLSRTALRNLHRYVCPGYDQLP